MRILYSSCMEIAQKDTVRFEHSILTYILSKWLKVTPMLTKNVNKEDLFELVSHFCFRIINEIIIPAYISVFRELLTVVYNINKF